MRRRVAHPAPAIALYFANRNFGPLWVIEGAMQSAPRRIARHLFIVCFVFVLLTAVAIWLGLGPVVHS